MNKVFHFEVPRESYRCDAAVVSCFDNRFALPLNKFLKRTGIGGTDAITIAGGAKTLSSPDRESEREVVLDQIRKSIRLHGTKRVILIVHSDCGAYGGLAGAFGGDTQKEEAHHEQELRRAAAILRREIPGLDVLTYFANFEGVWEVDPAPQRAASPGY